LLDDDLAHQAKTIQAAGTLGLRAGGELECSYRLIAAGPGLDTGAAFADIFTLEDRDSENQDAGGGSIMAKVALDGLGGMIAQEALDARFIGQDPSH
jgi:hypothetical protein